MICSNSSIIASLNADYGIVVKTLTLLSLGADINASVYKAESEDNKCYFIKVKRKNYNPDFTNALLRLLVDAGVQHIILPILTLQGQQAVRFDDVTLLVYPFIHGKDGFNCDLTDQQWVLLGQALRKIHAVQVPQSLQNNLRRESFSPQWRDAVLSLYAKIENVSAKDAIDVGLLKFLKKIKYSY